MEFKLILFYSILTLILSTYTSRTLQIQKKTTGTKVLLHRHNTLL